MSKSVQYPVNIPFQGFYCSIWSDIIDSELISECQEQNCLDRGIPECLTLESIDMSDDLWQYVDHESAETDLARAYVESMAKETGAPLTFKSLWSPKEYNFQTDQIDATLPGAFVRKIWAEVKKERTTLARLVKERHSSRSGFISFYSDELESWLSKSHTKLDLHELGTVFRAWLSISDKGGISDDLEMALYYSIADSWSGNACTLNYVDWEKWESAVNKKRLEVLEAMPVEELALLWDSSEWLRDNFSEVNPNIASDNYRCPLTTDMFAGGRKD